MAPKVSIVMPVQNGEKYIGVAIESILAQKYDNHELVIVDDGSIDRTAELVESFRHKLSLKYVRHEVTRGIAPSMNDGVRNAAGQFISFLDHDDAWFPEFLETQVGYLQEHTDVGMVHSDFQTIDTEGHVIEPSVAACRGRRRPSGCVFPELFMDSFIVGNSVLIRRECFERLGLFDESLRWGDYHMWLRIARNYQVDYVPKVLTQYRQHPTQSTRSPGGRPDEDPVALLAIRKILELYPEIRQELGPRMIQRRIASFYFDLGYNWYTKGEFSNARVCLRRALRLWPWRPGFLALYTSTMLGPAKATAMRKAWRRIRGIGKPDKAQEATEVRGITA